MNELEQNAALEALSRLAAIELLLQELVEVDSGESIAVSQRFVFDATHPFRDWRITSDQAFHAVKIDNPTSCRVYVGFEAGAGAPGRYDELVPPRAGRCLVRPFEQVSLGFDPGNMPARAVLPVTFYSRPLQPATWSLAVDPDAAVPYGFESLTVGAQAVGLALAGIDPDVILTVTLTVENAPIRYRPDGAATPPTGSDGFPLAVGDVLTACGNLAELAGWRFIRDASAGADATLDVIAAR
jgi:hypothetical protein